MIHSKGLLITLASGLTGIALVAGAAAQAGRDGLPAAPRSSSETKEATMPALVVLAMHADWCGSCRVLGPKLMEEVIPASKDQPYLFVKLDQTNRDSKQAEYHFAALGLSEAWPEHAGKTGYALVVDPKENRILGRLTHNQNPDAMISMLRNASNR